MGVITLEAFPSPVTQSEVRSSILANILSAAIVVNDSGMPLEFLPGGKRVELAPGKKVEFSRPAVFTFNLGNFRSSMAWYEWTTTYYPERTFLGRETHVGRGSILRKGPQFYGPFDEVPADFAEAYGLDMDPLLTMVLTNEVFSVAAEACQLFRDEYVFLNRQFGWPDRKAFREAHRRRKAIIRGLNDHMANFSLEV